MDKEKPTTARRDRHGQFSTEIGGCRREAREMSAVPPSRRPAVLCVRTTAEAAEAALDVVLLYARAQRRRERPLRGFRNSRERIRVIFLIGSCDWKGKQPALALRSPGSPAWPASPASPAWPASPASPARLLLASLPPCAFCFHVRRGRRAARHTPLPLECAGLPLLRQASPHARCAAVAVTAGVSSLALFRST